MCLGQPRRVPAAKIPDMGGGASDVDGDIGVDFDHGPSSANRLGDLVVPQLVWQAFNVEVARSLG